MSILNATAYAIGEAAAYLIGGITRASALE